MSDQPLTKERIKQNVSTQLKKLGVGTDQAEYLGQLYANSERATNLVAGTVKPAADCSPLGLGPTDIHF